MKHTGSITARRRRPLRRHPALLPGRGPLRLRRDAPAREDPHEHRLGRAGRLLRSLVGGLPRHIEPTGEDALYAHISFESGAVGQWINDHAGHGQPLRSGWSTARRARSSAPGDRNGRPVKLHLDDGTVIADEHILEYAPSYRLEPAGRRAVRRRARLDLQLRVQRHRLAHPRARVLRAWRVRPHRRRSPK